MRVLAPAGGWEQLRAAVFAGADEVYLGGRAFGARANAQNFSQEELRGAVAFCHARGVRLHVTVNTLLKDSELPAALEFVEFLCSLPVDAVLVQDMGLFALLRQRAPALPLHASTQMSLHNPAGVRLAHALGASRVVLARELSLEEIERIAKSCPVELESFVHGALCMCVSGQCYLSAALGGRSGNRGQCAQPCRLPFAAPGGTGHDLSLKDLSFIAYMDRLAQAGVCSAKIEGRMKRPEYVAAATAACRLAADGKPVPPELFQDLEAVFSRSGFTNGYLTGHRGREMFGTRRKEDVTAATQKVLAGLRGLYRGEGQRVLVSFSLASTAGGLCLTASDQEGRCASALAPAELEAGARPDVPLLDPERCRAQLRKTGGTPFLAEKVEVPEEGAAISVSGLNALRRQALEALLEKRAWREAIPWERGGNCAPIQEAAGEAEGRLDESLALLGAGREAGAAPRRQDKAAGTGTQRHVWAAPEAGSPLAKKPCPAGTKEERLTGKSAPTALRVCFRSVEQLPPREALKDCAQLALPLETPLPVLEQLREAAGPQLVLELPRALFGQEDQVRRLMEERMHRGFEQFTCGNLGTLALCRELGARAHGAFSLNITNSAALEAFAALGLESAEASFELSGREFRGLKRGILPLGAMVYGRQALMLTRNCPLANSPKGCLGCKTPGALTDRKGMKFPVVCRERGRFGSELLNSVPLWLGGEEPAADFLLLRFTVESPVECGKVLEAFRQGKKLEGPHTSGLFRRGVE
ncbi:MAG: U32 family peptidase [Acutalibacter sp.]|nr:U32 family peptidase [Acutalibacter sp.]